ncbi:uncharacterized protein PRCAT00002735001 [Priceomyces carsonii]|uniref:uncharacterized protein n=1 Tax=Priceomyces carsonii TaxID=28549 RepID=UPI002ED8CF94|nr:unnamed protein product [Priceomyces carsonii]
MTETFDDQASLVSISVDSGSNNPATITPLIHYFNSLCGSTGSNIANINVPGMDHGSTRENIIRSNINGTSAREQIQDSITVKEKAKGGNTMSREKCDGNKFDSPKVIISATEEQESLIQESPSIASHLKTKQRKVGNLSLRDENETSDQLSGDIEGNLGNQSIGGRHVNESSFVFGQKLIRLIKEVFHRRNPEKQKPKSKEQETESQLKLIAKDKQQELGSSHPDNVAKSPVGQKEYQKEESSIWKEKGSFKGSSFSPMLLKNNQGDRNNPKSEVNSIIKPFSERIESFEFHKASRNNFEVINKKGPKGHKLPNVNTFNQPSSESTELENKIFSPKTHRPNLSDVPTIERLEDMEDKKRSCRSSWHNALHNERDVSGYGEQLSMNDLLDELLHSSEKATLVSRSHLSLSRFFLNSRKEKRAAISMKGSAQYSQYPNRGFSETLSAVIVKIQNKCKPYVHKRQKTSPSVLMQTGQPQPLS